MKLTNAQRRNLIKSRHIAIQQTHYNGLQENAVGEIPISKQEIKETVHEMDSFQEFDRTKKTENDALTSDEM